jgi:hypothetical protein
MAISGSLSDVAVADVLQFIHLGRRSGTLVLQRDGDDVRFSFCDGKMVSARAPDMPTLGELLLQQGRIAPDVMQRLVIEQRRLPQRELYGHLLLREGVVDHEGLRHVLEQQFEIAVTRVMGWERGSFEFLTGDPRLDDDIAVAWGAAGDLGINPQVILLEAARIFDERDARRGPEAAAAIGAVTTEARRPSPAATLSTALRTTQLWRQGLQPAAAEDVAPEPAREPAAEAPRLEVQVVTADDTLSARLLRALQPQQIRVRRWRGTEVEPRAAGRPDVVVVDLRGAESEEAQLAAARERSPEATLIAVVGPEASYRNVFAAGAHAVLPPEGEAIVAFVEHLAHDTARVPRDSGAALSRLRRVYAELRSGLLSATASLSLMHLISESFERAVLLIVKQRALVALGAFGDDSRGQPLAATTRGLELDVDEDHLLARSLRDGESCRASFEEAQLPEPLATILGRPRNGEAVAFPVTGIERVIGVIYADNGDRPEPPSDVEILDLAAAQVGLALENELLRRQINRSDS